MRLARGTVARVGIPCLLSGVLTGLSGCGAAHTMRTSDVEQQVEQDLTKQASGTFVVTCPTDIPAEAGYAFTCSVEDQTTSTTFQVSVVEDDDQGAFSWRVTKAPAPAP